MDNKISIIIPTYNERENLPVLIKRLNEALVGYVYEFIVIDDDSPDGTWEEAQELSKKYPIIAIKREEKGLSTAVIRGIQESNNDIIVVMDADLQHPPEKVPELIKQIDNGADIAIGSRFVEGGSVGEWSYSRLLVSKGAKFLATTLFRNIRSIKDIESGFFAFKKKILNGVKLEPVGYKILLEILVMANYQTVKEVGFEFQTRVHGESKLGFKNIFNYLHHLLSLSWRTREIHRFIKFCIIGGIGAIVNILILYFLTENLEVHYLISGAIGIEAGLLSNFALNKIWTFKDVQIRGTKATAKALFKDHIVRSGGIIINIVVLWFLTSIVEVHYLLSQVMGIFIAMMWNFGGNKWWTWE